MRKEEEERENERVLRQSEVSVREREMAIREAKGRADALLIESEAKRKARRLEAETREYFLELCRTMKSRDSAGRIAFGRQEWEMVKEDMLELVDATLKET